MSRPFVVLAAIVAMGIAGCRQSPSGPTAQITKIRAQAPAAVVTAPDDTQATTSADGPALPTAEELAPLRPEYLAELAKIHEPPEMAGKPMEIRKNFSADMLRLGDELKAVGDPEKASHAQRATAIRELVEIAQRTQASDPIDQATTYGAIAVMACLDGADPQTVVAYTNQAKDPSDDVLALRARMYLEEGDSGKALDDLEALMARGGGHALTGGAVDPRKDSGRCQWSMADLDALGLGPRALAAKGAYLGAFLAVGAESRGTVRVADIRDLYARSAQAWRSAIPHLLAANLDGVGGEHFTALGRCLRRNSRIYPDPDATKACETVDEGVRQAIRELTMALVMEPSNVGALSARADRYLHLAENAYADGKPSRQWLQLAVKDYDAAMALPAGDRHMLSCDRGLALASLGRYREAAAGYLEGMKYAKDGIEDSPFVFEQLAGVDMKLGKFQDAAGVLTQAIMNSEGSGMEAVIFGGGMKAFRGLYPEYDVLPDEILAEVVRRRFQPQFPQKWDTEFISKAGVSDGRVVSSILPELYVERGDAYMKVGRKAEGMADYRRVRSDVWGDEEAHLPRHLYFDERGVRIVGQPTPWPPAPPKA